MYVVALAGKNMNWYVGIQSAFSGNLELQVLSIFVIAQALSVSAVQILDSHIYVSDQEVIIFVCSVSLIIGLYLEIKVIKLYFFYFKSLL